MTRKTKDHKKQYKVNSRPILNLLVGLGFFTVVFLVTMLSAAKDDNVRNYSNNKAPLDNNQSEQTKAPADKIIAVVKAIDLDNKSISLFDVNRQRMLELSYNGGSNITDKYGKIKSISQIEIGSMVDVAYLEDKMKLTDMNISTNAWEYVGVNNFTMNLNANTMKIASKLYRYDDNIFVLNGLEAVPITTLTEQDELTVRGYEDTIWSIIVTRGHGTVVLEDYEPFLGAFITIGYESIQQIEEGMEIAVREGSFNLTIENGEYSATKNITVYRNQITNVTLSDLGPAALQQGRIVFAITPFGADLLIDGEYASYANPIELTYGKHEIKVSLGGYTTYNGILNVDSAGKTIKINLPEYTSADTVTVTETESTDSLADNTDDSDTVDTDTNSDNNDTGTEDNTNTNETEGDIDEDHLIYVQKPTGASVYINGSFKSISPGSFPKVIGTHVITFIKEGYKTMSYTIEVADDGLDNYYSFPDLVQE